MSDQPNSQPNENAPHGESHGEGQQFSASAPQPGAPQHSAPQPAPSPFSAPQFGAPQPEFPGAQQPGTQHDGPQYGGAQHGDSQYGGPQNGAPQYGNSQNGAPQFGAPQYGAPQNGAPGYGAPQYGAPQGAFPGQPQPGYYGAPQQPHYGGPMPAGAPLQPQEEKTAAMWAHLSGIAWVAGLGFVGPLIVFFMYKDRSPFVRQESREAVNFQLTMLIATAAIFIIGTITSIIGIGLVILLFWWVAPLLGIIFAIIGGVRVNGGGTYRYPMSIRMVK
ncbi:DUF4870 domain-containing protein [Humidisolicoccus flavus]|uniref:DUF4870 domain-containing protein n=1 Tax=Humidisolicoccus flavus TaxID=3111414 RepID=UPI00325258CB